MGALLKLVSYLLHPLYIPFAGTLAYFLLTPGYHSIEAQAGILVPIFILTVLIPLLFYVIVRNLALGSNIQHPLLYNEKYPLYLILALLLVVVIRVIPNHLLLPLHFFFLGLIAATFAALLLIFLNFRCSLHLVGMGSLLMFLIHLSIHLEQHMIGLISLITILTGLVATARLYITNNNWARVLTGLVLGMGTQLFTIKFWL
ncbi:MAG: hypothetical protein R3299_02460 [Arenibacter sp.]|nr:hypothetical protein [Arenibacter sp.]